jgi:hypothetical protein
MSAGEIDGFVQLIICDVALAFDHYWARFLGWPFVLQNAWVSGSTIFLPYAVRPIMAVLALTGAFSRSMPHNSGGRSLGTPCCSAWSASRSTSTAGMSRRRSGRMRCWTALRARGSSYRIAEVCCVRASVA